MCIAAHSFIMLYGSCQTPLTSNIGFLGTLSDVFERMRVAEYKRFFRAGRADKRGGDVDYTASSWIMEKYKRCIM